MDKAKWLRYWHFILVGSLIGALLSSWFAPRFIAWYVDPPVDIGVTCRAATEWSMRNLQRFQFWGLLLGSTISVVLATILERRQSTAPKSEKTT